MFQTTNQYNTTRHRGIRQCRTREILKQIKYRTNSCGCIMIYHDDSWCILGTFYFLQVIVQFWSWNHPVNSQMGYVLVELVTEAGHDAAHAAQGTIRWIVPGDSQRVVQFLGPTMSASKMLQHGHEFNGPTTKQYKQSHTHRIHVWYIW